MLIYCTCVTDISKGHFTGWSYTQIWRLCVFVFSLYLQRLLNLIVFPRWDLHLCFLHVWKLFFILSYLYSNLPVRNFVIVPTVFSMGSSRHSQNILLERWPDTFWKMSGANHYDICILTYGPSGNWQEKCMKTYRLTLTIVNETLWCKWAEIIHTTFQGGYFRQLYNITSIIHFWTSF